jgi:hypothetical protein
MSCLQDALRYGSSSAPALDQQLRQRQGSPTKSTRGSRGGLRGSGSLGKPKVSDSNVSGARKMPKAYADVGVGICPHWDLNGTPDGRFPIL